VKLAGAVEVAEVVAGRGEVVHSETPILEVSERQMDLDEAKIAEGTSGKDG
jgi:hypothetical protein